MGNIRHPRRGSLQYWPRKRAKAAIARVRFWPAESKAKPLGFVGYKAGMTHLIVTDNHPKSPTKGEPISMAATVVECPPLTVAGMVFYRRDSFGWKKSGSCMAEKAEKNLQRRIPVHKKKGKYTLDSLPPFDDLRLLVQVNPSHIPSLNTKMPHLVELALGGSAREKLDYAKTMLGKELAVGDVFEEGSSIDVHSITKGKGFQGTVKRYGVPIRQHKAEKTKRGIGTLGSWTPKRVEFSVAQPGKMGYHLRTEYNKQILKIGKKEDTITPRGGFPQYGVLHNACLILKGSIPGSRKRAVMMIPSIRPAHGMTKEAPPITYVHR